MTHGILPHLLTATIAVL